MRYSLILSAALWFLISCGSPAHAQVKYTICPDTWVKIQGSCFRNYDAYLASFYSNIAPATPQPTQAVVQAPTSVDVGLGQTENIDLIQVVFFSNGEVGISNLNPHIYTLFLSNGTVQVTDATGRKIAEYVVTKNFSGLGRSQDSLTVTITRF